MKKKNERKNIFSASLLIFFLYFAFFFVLFCFCKARAPFPAHRSHALRWSNISKYSRWIIHSPSACGINFSRSAFWSSKYFIQQMNNYSLAFVFSLERQGKSRLNGSFMNALATFRFSKRWIFRVSSILNKYGLIQLRY